MENCPVQSIEISNNFVLNLKEIVTLRLPNPFAFAIIFAYLSWKTLSMCSVFVMK